MLDIWRQEAVYSFDFWPEAVVEQPKKLVFALEHARFSIRYARVGEWQFETAREVAEGTEQRVLALASESMPVVTSGARPLDGCVGEAWYSTFGLENEGTIAHVIGCDMGAGIVAKLHMESSAPPLCQSAIELVEAVAQRLERSDIVSLVRTKYELDYALGPLRILVPKEWEAFSRVDARLKGAKEQWVGSHLLTFEFSSGREAPAEWLDIPTYVDRMLLIDGVIAEGKVLHATFPAGTVSARAWAALPPPDDDDPEDVETEAVAVVRWPAGTACKITAIQEIPFGRFERARDLARLRDLVLRIAGSSCCEPRR